MAIPPPFEPFEPSEPGPLCGPLSQCLLQIGNQIIHVFDAYGEAQETGGDAAGLPFFFGEVAVGLGGGIGDEAFNAAKTFGEADEFHIFQHLKGRFVAVGVEGEHGTGAAGLFEVDVPSREIGKAGVEDFGDFRMVFQPLCQDLCIFLYSRAD